MKYIKKLIRNSKRVLNQQVIKKKQEIVKYAPRLTGIQVNKGVWRKSSAFSFHEAWRKKSVLLVSACWTPNLQKSPSKFSRVLRSISLFIKHLELNVLIFISLENRKTFWCF